MDQGHRDYYNSMHDRLKRNLNLAHPIQAVADADEPEN
jgi:hypothetical protein